MDNNKCRCSICSMATDFEMPEDIVEATTKGKLVLFCGAGISTESKLVLNTSFYQEIRKELKCNEDISFSKLMSKYCNQPNGRRKMILKIKKRFDYINSFPKVTEKATRFHKEVAHNYLIKSIVTTNWDEYFERYCDAIPIVDAKDMLMLESGSRCVIKIHGSINNISNIVATENDYESCKERLSSGAIGSWLKTNMLSKTFVFIGFSFGDEDFEYIYDMFIKELGEYAPHIYIITIDDNLKDKLKYKNLTIIKTDGTYFIHKLNNILADKNVLVPKEKFDDVEEFFDELVDIHTELPNTISYLTCPGIIYTYIYQDGLIDALERFQARDSGGEYYAPGYIATIANNYQKLIDECNKYKLYFKSAYFEGYLNGLTFLLLNKDERELIPLYYLCGEFFSKNDMDIFVKELFEFNKCECEEKNLAQEYIDNELKGELIPQYYPGY
ncbi:hypothetical protein FDF11_06290 [Clostridium botulinum]|nr:hypothetical protein [Clostridium botulinum]NFR15448.1 hypothetical protein [Clostridium botulinum]NFR43266.1 hypothetical protein [Clostridium botulinum]NFS50307.1 hypothetical protein [Clostridium botulinum]